MDEHSTRRCPRCSSEVVVPIAYGLPSPEMVESSRRGELALGGCVRFGGAPDYTCRNCGHEWQRQIPWLPIRPTTE